MLYKPAIKAGVTLGRNAGCVQPASTLKVRSHAGRRRRACDRILQFWTKNIHSGN